MYSRHFLCLYILLLVVSGSGCSRESDSLVESTTLATAIFELPNNTCVAPCTVQFDNQSLGSSNSYAWNFGDGASSSDYEPTHTYPTAGSYTITLVATNSLNSSTTTRVLTVTN